MSYNSSPSYGSNDTASEWDKKTIIRKKSQPPPRSMTAVNAAMAKGSPVEISKKFNAGTNKTTDIPSSQYKKAAESDDITPPTMVSHDIGKIIMRARQTLSMTQKELAAKICEKLDIIHDYESGKAVTNPTILGKIERVLNVKLRGSNVGAPLK